MNNEAKAVAPQVLLRFMLYTDVNRRRAAQVGIDRWVDFESVSEGQYNYGTEHELTFAEFDHQPGLYRVAMMPHLRQIAHPSQNDRQISLQTIYLTTAALWPFFEPITWDSLNLSMMPD